MSIPVPKGFDPIRGLFGSSICFLITFLGLVLLSTLVFTFIALKHSDIYNFDLESIVKFFSVWLSPILLMSIVFACNGWLTYSTRMETKPYSFVISLIIIFMTTILIQCLFNVLNWNAFQNALMKSIPVSPRNAEYMMAGVYPFLATVLLTSFMFAKSLWFKDRSIVNATERPTVSKR